MESNGQNQLAMAREPAGLVDQHVPNVTNGIYALGGGLSSERTSGGGSGSDVGTAHAATGQPGGPDLHTPTPTREVPNPLAGVAAPAPFGGLHLGYTSGSALSGSTPFQAQTPMPPNPAVYTHRSNPSLASVASSTASTSSSSFGQQQLHDVPQEHSPASAASSPSGAVAGITSGQAGMSLGSSVSAGPSTPAIPSTLFTFSQSMPLHISTSSTVPTVSQPRTPSSASTGSTNSGSGLQIPASQPMMHGIALAGSNGAILSNPTTPMPQQQVPVFPSASVQLQGMQDQTMQQAQLEPPAPVQATRWESGTELALRAAEEVSCAGPGIDRLV